MSTLHTLSILVTNEAGVLSRVVDLFSGRGYNIESLTVAPTIDRNYSRITITTVATSEAIEQICKQLHRLIPVLKVSDLSVNEAIEREIVMVKIQVKDEDADKILRRAHVTGEKVIDITDKNYTLRMVADEKQIQALIELIKPYGYKDFVRSGKVAIARG